MSNNLNLDQLATNQASPEVPINDANAQLDAALTEITTLDMTLADIDVTLAQWRAAILFKVTSVAPVAADGLLTGDGTNVTNGNTVTIGIKVYTFQTTLTNVDGNVQIGASAAASLTNLFNAINLTGVAGTDYATAMTKNTKVTATNPTATTVHVVAIVPGAVGNAIITTFGATHVSWGAANLVNGTGGSTITLPQIKRGLMLLESATANTTFSLVLGSVSFTINPGRLYAVWTDGNVNGMAARDIGGIAEPNDMSIFLPGTMSNAQLCYRRKATRAFTLPLGLSGAYFLAGAAATASTVVTLKKNGTSIGTLTWAIAGTVPTVAFTGAVSFAGGDTFSVHGPATADATLADISFDFFGNR